MGRALESVFGSGLTLQRLRACFSPPLRTSGSARLFKRLLHSTISIGWKSNPYRYRPLERSREIRLVGISPAQDPIQPLHLDIYHADLDDSPQYSALSYEWKNETPHVPIRCNETSSTFVTSNCYRALKRLRSTEKMVPLWVDAICINQSDTQERNAQVSMMFDIYRSAVAATVWLGDGITGSDRVIKFARRATFFYLHPWLRRVLLYNGMKSWNRLGTGCSNAELLSVIDCSYWTRMWTVQEFVVSTPIIYLGGDTEVHGIHLLQAIQDVLKSDPLLIVRSGYHAMLHSEFHGYGQPDYRTPYFRHMFFAILQMSSTDGRDKVFALKGLYPALKELAVDYNMPVWSVYAEATRLMVIDENSLDVLQFVAKSAGETRLPSWALNWDDKMIKPLTDFDESSERVSPMIKFKANGRVLQLSGILINRVRVSSSISEIFPELDHRGGQFISQGEPISGETYIKVCLQILFTFWEEKCKLRYPGFERFLRAVTRLLDPEYEITPEASTSIVKISLGLKNTGIAELSKHYVPSRKYLHGTVLFLTIDGRFGVARGNGIRPGDRIALVKGYDKAMVLRPTLGKYILVTSALIYGLTDSNTWPDDPSLHSSIEII